MKKLSKKQKLIGFIAILLVAIIIAIVITASIINNNNQVTNEGYLATTANSDSEIIANYIKKGITIGGVTGKLESLNTFDATATAEDIIWGKTGYVKGEKITGTKIVTIAQAQEAKVFFQNNKNLIDDLDNTVVVPSGFKIAEDSATVVEDGIVIEDKDGNQFVWIPAKTGTGTTINLSSGGTAKGIYARTDFGKQNGSYSNYSETMSSDEETSVNSYGGYYIGRFEAGDKESTEAKKMREKGASQTNTITIKKDQVPYNYITRANAKSKAEEMDDIQGYVTSTTKLVSSYAWDTAINFIQIKNSDYGTNSLEGNYKNTTFLYTDITGKEQTKNKGSSILVPTGQTTAVSNIYDMGGNLEERTTENNSSDSSPYVYRGGIYYDNCDISPAGYRYPDDGNVYSFHGFRVTLYL